MASAELRREFRAYLDFELNTATSLGLDHLGLPISSDAIESLFGVAKRHGVDPLQDATRMAFRLPPWCGTPSREEVQQLLEVSVTTQEAFTAQAPSLTRQRREVLKHPERLESLAQKSDDVKIELLPSPKNRSNRQVRVPISIGYHDEQGPRSEASNVLLNPQTQAVHDVAGTACVM